MSDKKQNNDLNNEETEGTEKSGLLYEDVPPEVYEDDDQIRVKDLLNIIWDGRMKILIVTALLFCFAVFHYVTAPEEYVAESRFLPERQVQQFQFDRMFAFGEFARQLNIGGAESDGSLPSYFYVDIIASVEFQRKLLSQEIELINSGRTMTLFEFFTDLYEQPFRTRVYSFIRRNTIGLPTRFFLFITNIFKSEDVSQSRVLNQRTSDATEADSLTARHAVEMDRYLIVSPEFEAASDQVVGRVNVDYGTLTYDVTTTMPDPMAAVQLNAYVADLMQEYLINYRVQKARENLVFIEGLYEEAEERYERTSRDLAIYEDSNKGDMSAVASLERERLRERKNLAYSLYTSVASRLEEARSRVNEDTPIYTSFQEPIFPTQPIGANLMILPASIIIGIFLGVLWVFFEKFMLIIGQIFGWSRNK
tara:strand:+ start:10251 stop:11516 length:1266 start_codon:yes stop_codon:yes gene_type:complete